MDMAAGGMAKRVAPEVQTDPEVSMDLEVQMGRRVLRAGTFRTGRMSAAHMISIRVVAKEASAATGMKRAFSTMTGPTLIISALLQASKVGAIDP